MNSTSLEHQKRAPDLIVMLTHQDETVHDACELFDQLKELPVTWWGFKDIGLSKEKMATLISSMRAAGKTTCLEVVSLSEEEGLAGAHLAVELGLDILMGTVYYDSIHDYLKGKPVRYFPFIGHVYGHPSILGGSIPEVVQQARELEAKGVQGFDLLTYRYTGDAPRLLAEVVRATRLPVVSAGSIADFSRIQEVWDAGATGFTIGSAFFDKTFVPDGDLQQNIRAVCSWLQGTYRAKQETIQ